MLNTIIYLGVLLIVSILVLYFVYEASLSRTEEEEYFDLRVNFSEAENSFDKD